MRLIRRWNSPTLFLTAPETVLSTIAALIALVALLSDAYLVAVLAFLIWGFFGYRSQRRFRAANRAGLRGFIAQGSPVGDEELDRKVEAIHRELGDWHPGLTWLEEVAERQRGGR
jgi:hypothetical protein